MLVRLYISGRPQTAVGVLHNAGMERGQHGDKEARAGLKGGKGAGLKVDGVNILPPLNLQVLPQAGYKVSLHLS